MFKVEFSDNVAGFDQNVFHHHLDNTLKPKIMERSDNDNSLLIHCRQLYRHGYIWQHKNRIQTIKSSVHRTFHDV